jgi:cell division protein FtsB
MRGLLIVLVIILLLLQFRLWFGEGSISQKMELDRQLAVQKQQNEALKLRNRLIAKEVDSLKDNLDSIEEKARKDLGMIKDNETFYLVIDKNNRSSTEEKSP